MALWGLSERTVRPVRQAALLTFSRQTETQESRVRPVDTETHGDKRLQFREDYSSQDCLINDVYFTRVSQRSTG